MHVWLITLVLLQDGTKAVGTKNVIIPNDAAALRKALIKHTCEALGDDAKKKLPVWCGRK